MLSASQSRLARLARDIAAQVFYRDDLPAHEGPIQPPVPTGGLHRPFDSGPGGADPSGKDGQGPEPAQPPSGGQARPASRSENLLKEWLEKLKPLRGLIAREAELYLLMGCRVTEVDELGPLAAAERSLAEADPNFIYAWIREGCAALDKDAGALQAVREQWKAASGQLLK
jgi:hypothetical protein